MQTILASWIAVLKNCGLEAMAWAALPTILGETYLQQNRRIRHKIVDAIVRRNRKDHLLAHLEAMSTYPPPAGRAANLTCPTLILAGDQDPMVTVSQVQKLSALCRGRHAVIPGVGHTVPVEAPQLFNRLVADFLEGP
jgi:3-oxoadipate enol-lactonase